MFGTWVGLIASCSAWQTDPDGFSEQERELITGMKLVATVSDPSNPVLMDKRAERFGQALFFDPELSGPLARASTDQAVFLGDAGVAGRIACVDCHAPTGFFDDSRSTPSNVSLGIDFTTRNSPSLVNVAFYQVFAWDGRSDSLWMQCGIAHESKAATGGTRLRLARRVAAVYAPQYESLFLDAGFPRLARIGSEETEFDFLDGGVPSAASAAYLNRIAANSYKVMAAYISMLQSVNAPIDAYAGGDFAALSPSAKRGLKLFIGRAGCVDCHTGPNFTDNQFHSVGVPQRGEHVPLIDQGRFDGLGVLAASPFNNCGAYSGLGPCTISAPQASDRGQFRTKSLRNVARTPPFMHAGQFQTLEEVVRFYNAGGEANGFVGTKSPKTVPLGLTQTEIVDLVAFLDTLSGGPVDSKLACDPSPRDNVVSAHRFAACPDGGL